MPEAFAVPALMEMNGDHCGHRCSGITGCRRCIDYCDHHAMQPGRTVPLIDPQACRGCGNCVAACPSGSLQLLHPVSDKFLYLIVEQAAESSIAPIVVFYERGRPLPEPGEISASGVILIEYEPIGALGMETILSAFAAGAKSVFVLTGPETGSRTLHLLDEQVLWSNILIQAMGYRENAISLLKFGERNQIPTGSTINHDNRLTATLSHSVPSGTKRSRILWAIKQLTTRSTVKNTVVSLPAGAPYGDVILDTRTCTFCMACTSLCPTHALRPGGNIVPEILFKESECIQCGLCVSGCPESALRLRPRMHFGAQLDGTIRRLKGGAPFNCIRCNEPFATKAMIEAMVSRLTGHWMFATDAEKRRLMMCRTCRIKDMFEKKGDKKST